MAEAHGGRGFPPSQGRDMKFSIGPDIEKIIYLKFYLFFPGGVTAPNPPITRHWVRGFQRYLSRLSSADSEIGTVDLHYIIIGTESLNNEKAI